MANWQDIKNKITTFRNYVQGLTPAGKAAAKYAFMLEKADIQAMLDQAGGAQNLDGIRAYIGADMVDGQMIPTLYFVAVQKDGSGSYNDYRIGTTLPPNPSPLVAEAPHPCPTWCGSTNFLNS